MSDSIRTFSTGYMDRGVFNLPEVIETAKLRLADVDFDTLIGTGFSGSVVIPSLAMAMGKTYVLVRKPGVSSHSHRDLLGELGERFVFVDDFVSSGATRRRVFDTLKAEVDLADQYRSPVPPLPTCVGEYMYAKAFETWTDCWSGWYHYGIFYSHDEIRANALDLPFIDYGQEA